MKFSFKLGRKHLVGASVLVLVVFGFGFVYAGWANSSGVGHSLDELQACLESGKMLKMDSNGVDWTCGDDDQSGDGGGFNSITAGDGLYRVLWPDGIYRINVDTSLSYGLTADNDGLGLRSDCLVGSILQYSSGGGGIWACKPFPPTSGYTADGPFPASPCRSDFTGWEGDPGSVVRCWITDGPGEYSFCALSYMRYPLDTDVSGYCEVAKTSSGRWYVKAEKHSLHNDDRPYLPNDFTECQAYCFN